MEIAVFHLFCVFKFQCAMWSIPQNYLEKKNRKKNYLRDLNMTWKTYSQSFLTQTQSHFLSEEEVLLSYICEEEEECGHIRRNPKNLVPLSLLKIFFGKKSLLEPQNSPKQHYFAKLKD